MFNIFKKKEPVQQEEKQGNNYPAAVVEIHREFHTAADRLLEDARATILEAGKKDALKVSRLERLGFKLAAQVTEAKPLIKKAELSKEKIDLVNLYSLRYPNNKFITEQQAEVICTKWNLVCGPVASFTGFVPEKNLKQIEDFEVNQEDVLVDAVRITRAWNTGTNDFTSRSRGADHIHKVLGVDVIPCNDPRLIWHKDGLFGLNAINPSGTAYVTKYEHIDRTGLRICAPKKEMNVDGLKKTGFSFFKVTEKHVPDPVVLQPVKGGYLIVTAWGDEASDENVVNQKFN